VSNAQNTFDLDCGEGIQSADEMAKGHSPVDISPIAADQMESYPLIQVFTPPANHFVVYGGGMNMGPGGGPILYPALIIWEVRIGGRNYVNSTPLVIRKTLLVDDRDRRRGLLFAIQGPLFRQVLLSARLASIPPAGPQTGKLTMNLDAMVTLMGWAADLRVHVGDLVG